MLRPLESNTSSSGRPQALSQHFPWACFDVLKRSCFFFVSGIQTKTPADDNHLVWKAELDSESGLNPIKFCLGITKKSHTFQRLSNQKSPIPRPDATKTSLKKKNPVSGINSCLTQVCGLRPHAYHTHRHLHKRSAHRDEYLRQQNHHMVFARTHFGHASTARQLCSTPFRTLPNSPANT